jgi:SET domain-containing protein
MDYLQNKSIKLFILRFKKWDFVIEYTGEVIRNALADYRELTYNE